MIVQTHQYAELHDAELVSVSHGKNDQMVSFGFVRSDGNDVSITLCGVQVIRIVDFISQNVVSRVLCSESMQFDKTGLSRMVRWANSLSDGTCLISQEAIDSYISNIRAGMLNLLAIEPSWGGELVCIYEA